MKKFTNKIAKEIAFNQFKWTIGCVIGTDDPDFSFNNEIEDFEGEFIEKLQENQIAVTPARIQVINNYYENLVKKAKNTLKKLI